VVSAFSKKNGGKKAKKFFFAFIGAVPTVTYHGTWGKLKLCLYCPTACPFCSPLIRELPTLQKHITHHDWLEEC
jgi:hypothetical protein